MTTEPTTEEKARIIRETLTALFAELNQGLNIIDAQTKRGQLASARETVKNMRPILQLASALTLGPSVEEPEPARRCTFAAGGSNHCTQPRGHAGNHTPTTEEEPEPTK